jgi:histidinol-phosphate/aromatic aminotransferase/cobyric acid decarboxylase-like protein
MTDAITNRVPHGGAPAGWLDLSANVNPLGPPPAVQAAIAAAGYASYADLDLAPAVERLARDSAVDAGRIVVTSGATEALRLVVSGLVRPHDPMLIVGPTYGEYRRLGHLAGATIREVRAAPPHFDPPIDAILTELRASRPKLVVVCDPNNPTGRSIGADAWWRLLDAAGDAHVLVDESFAPFRAPSSTLPLDDARVIAVRSLTKVLGIPGVRAGFIVAQPAVAAALRHLADPWSVGSHALAAATAGGWTLDDCARQTIADWRTGLVAALEARASSVTPADANFVLTTVMGSTDGFVGALAADRIAVRSCASFGLAGVVRIAVPTPTELIRLVAALDRAGVKAA